MTCEIALLPTIIFDLTSFIESRIPRHTKSESKMMLYVLTSAARSCVSSQHFARSSDCIDRGQTGEVPRRGTLDLAFHRAAAF